MGFIMLTMLKACRIGKVTSIIIGVLTISIYALGSIDYLQNRVILLDILYGLASLFFLVCAGYLMNDYCDIKYDKINKPGKMAITKIVSKNIFRRIFLAFFALGMIIAVKVNIWFFLLILLDVFILLLYNLFSKKLPFLKSIIVALLVVSIYPLSLAITSGGNPSLRKDSLFIFPIWLFFVTLAYEIVQDSIDIRGDSQGGAKTLPMIIGAKKARNIATGCVILAIPVSFIPFYYGMCGKIYLIGALISLSIVIGSMLFRELIFSKGLLFYIRAITIASLVDILWK